MTDRAHLEVPLIYNLFPRLAGTLDEWPRHAARAAEMGFNWIFVNPIQYPGYSRSLYSISDHYRINPDFLPPGSSDNGFAELRTCLRQINDLGVWPMLDLVINHTAFDSPLVREHPEWYHRDERGQVRRPSAIDPADATKVTVWGDLAEIDNVHSPDREALWHYWGDVIKTYLELGFRGFRCDAAYKVPPELWRFLLGVATAVDPEARFFAETLGCRIEEVMALRDAGLHFLFNSSKWWDFRASWAIEQHYQYGQVAPSISFPESHDTARLAAESGGSEAIQRQRYAFGAAFSAGLMMPIGYEYGFRKQLDVVEMTPDDWETPAFDLSTFIRRVNRRKLNSPVLQGEGYLRPLTPPEAPALVLERYSDRAPGQPAWIIVNRSTDHGTGLPYAPTFHPGPQHRLFRICRDEAPEDGESPGQGLGLNPADVVYILPS